jgi:hypothetical protein
MKFSHDWMSDTHPDALRVYLEMNHRLPAQRKFDQVVGMCEGMALTYAVRERKLHPEKTEREIFLRVAARRLGKELVKRVYGDYPGE